MARDMAEIKFRGKMMRLLEGEYGASLAGDEDGAFVRSMYARYLESGSPKEVEPWIRERLAESFLFAVSPPQWIETSSKPRWPFLNGKPMVFIGQIAIPPSQVSEQHLSSNTMLYLFGARIEVPAGWKMQYTVLEQEPDL
jgi:hypothetical protein